MTDDNLAAPPEDSPSYTYRPSGLGSPWTFRLAADAILSEKGRNAARMPYSAISRVRMSYRPLTMLQHRFVTEIWAPGLPKLSVASVSFKSMFEQVRQDRPYFDFVTELHKRVAAAGGHARFEAGFYAPLYWIGALMAAATALALAGLTVRAIAFPSWSGAAIAGAFFAFFLWQSGNYLRRNRPGRYRPDALPADLLP